MARIVFCEDEEQIRKLIEAAMAQTAHEIEMTVNGHEGLLAIARRPPDLIVTDLAMPVMDGYALADAVRADPTTRQIAILFITASVQRGDVAKFAAHGAADYVAKPFSPRLLRDKIEQVLVRVAAAP